MGELNRIPAMLAFGCKSMQLHAEWEHRRHKGERESMMQNAGFWYADLWGSFGHCGTTNTAEVTEDAGTFWQKP